MRPPHCRFAMVCRDLPLSRALAAPQLSNISPKQQRLYEQGARNRRQRELRRSRSLRVEPPTQSEMRLLHTLLASGARPGDGSHVSIGETRRELTYMMQSQDRNAHDRIFGERH